MLESNIDRTSDGGTISLPYVLCLYGHHRDVPAS